jgi:hypothetical protein
MWHKKITGLLSRGLVGLVVIDEAHTIPRDGDVENQLSYTTKATSWTFSAECPAGGLSGIRPLILNKTKVELVRSFSRRTEKISLESNSVSDNYRIAIGTAAVNCGISNSKLVYAVRDCIPPSFFDLSQEAGRVGQVLCRENGFVDCYQVFLCVGSLVDLWVRIHVSESEGSKKSTTASACVKHQQQRELLEVLHLFVLALHCIHVSVEWHFLKERNIGVELPHDAPQESFAATVLVSTKPSVFLFLVWHWFSSCQPDIFTTELHC